MKVLIVDDAKIMRSIVKRTLRKTGFGDYDVSEASNGQEALDILREESFDLVLSDWNMGIMDGYQLLTEIKDNGIETKFCFITSEGTEDMRTKALEAGADSFIKKPFTDDIFRDNINMVVG